MKAIDQLLSKPVDRKQFLGHLGAGALAVVGVPVFVRALHEMGNHHQVQTNGYGSSPYGGATARTATLSSARTALIQ